MGSQNVIIVGMGNSEIRNTQGCAQKPSRWHQISTKEEILLFLEIVFWIRWQNKRHILKIDFDCWRLDNGSFECYEPRKSWCRLRLTGKLILVSFDCHLHTVTILSSTLQVDQTLEKEIFMLPEPLMFKAQFSIVGCIGPWWWSSGQRSCILLWQYPFKSCWPLKFSVWKDENKRKRGRGRPIFWKNSWLH